jgi:hypothetical protein
MNATSWLVTDLFYDFVSILLVEVAKSHQIGADDDATTCAFSRGCCEVNGTSEKAVCGGLPHLRKYDFLNIVKTHIPFRFKENIINFYFYYFNCYFCNLSSSGDVVYNERHKLVSY